MRLEEVQLPAYVSLQASCPFPKPTLFPVNQLQEVLQWLPWGVLKQGGKKTQSHWHMRKSEERRPNTGVGISNQTYTKFQVLLQNPSVSRLSRFPVVTSWACANRTSPARAQRKRSGFITGALIDTKVHRGESFLTLFFGLVNSTSRLNFLGFWVLEKSPRSSGHPVKQSWQMHTAQLGPHYMEWPFCD